MEAVTTPTAGASTPPSTGLTAGKLLLVAGVAFGVWWFFMRKKGNAS